MKKRILVYLLAVTSFVTACNDDNKGPKDELLSGTEWVYEYRESTHISSLDILGQILERFPDLEYRNAETVPEHITSEDTLCLRTDEKLKFNDNTCVFSHAKYYEIMSREKTYYYQKYIFEEQTLRDASTKLTIRINNDGIYRITNIQGQEISLLLYPLTDFSALRYQRTEILSETPNNSVLEDETETFVYERTENTITMTNEDRTLTGTLDPESGEISLRQLLPEEKEMNLFERVTPEK